MFKLKKRAKNIVVKIKTPPTRFKKRNSKRKIISNTTNDEYKKLTRDIIKSSDSIRQKYLALKLGESEAQRYLDTQLEPITTPLNILADKSTSNIKLVQLIKQDIDTKPYDFNVETIKSN